MEKRLCASIVLLAGVAVLASAIQTAQILPRYGVQAGIIGGYQNADNYIGGLGALLEMDFPFSKSLGIGLEAAGGENEADGPLAGWGLSVKYRILDLKHLELSGIGFGRGFYQFSPESPSYFLYGGGAEILATTKVGPLTLTFGGGASYDVYGDTDDPSAGALGPVGMLGLSYPLSKTSDLGLAFEYGGDRFFLGAYMDFATGRPAKAPAKKR
jgi:hypothetical protein